MKALTLTAAALAAAMFAPGPAAAQEQAGDKVNTIIIYGDDACPKSTSDEIVVCAVLDESERYRIPSSLREESNDPANVSWSERVKSFRYVGDFGTESCSASGLGGFTGCTNKYINEAVAERAARPSVRFGELIEAARAERLSNIDEEAAAVQARRDEIDAELDARERAKAQAADADTEGADNALPQPQ